jgi:predicted amidohydrolase
VRIAAVQHDIVREDRDADVERLAPQVRRAVGAAAERVLLTETFTPGSMTRGMRPLPRMAAGDAQCSGSSQYRNKPVRGSWM